MAWRLAVWANTVMNETSLPYSMVVGSCSPLFSSPVAGSSFSTVLIVISRFRSLFVVSGGSLPLYQRQSRWFLMVGILFSWRLEESRLTKAEEGNQHGWCTVVLAP
ncbi:hypothetical protein TanjilG_19498 [Lupinus angustifolius]|uniref:Uncharacterized protein n=1 Tax=Lupinus angustifolius TaxID=3871 RepID=A0A1J7I772_LUPAN|nr:hypothetical protein TanjilG_19498 [Lupinus angustifolius]